MMSKNTPAALVIQQVLLLLVLLFLFTIFLKETLPFIGGVLGAFTLYVLLVKSQIKLEKSKWKPSLAALFLITIATIALLIPIGVIILMLYGQVVKAIQKKDELQSHFDNMTSYVNKNTGIDLSEYANAGQLEGFLQNAVSGFANNGLILVIAIGVLYFILYYMLVERKKWKGSVRKYLPLKNENINTISHESYLLIKSNAIGIPLVAVCQGFVAVIGYYIFGVDNPWFWFVVTTVGSMIPFIGTAIGIFPVVILLLASGENTAAIGMLIYGLVVVGSTDNVFRLIVQKRLADLHPLITLFGVVIGIPLFGFVGLIFGPVLVSLFLLLAKIYHKEYIDPHGSNKEVTITDESN